MPSLQTEPSGPPLRRVFFSIPLSETQRVGFVHATRKAVRASGGRPVLPLDLHLTLVFVGAVADQVLPLLLSAGAAVSRAAGVCACQLAFDRLEHWARPRIFCAACTCAPAEAVSLVRGLEAALDEHGIPFERRPWKAHITLARNAQAPHIVGPITPLVWTATQFGLFESVPAPAVPRYQALELWPLPPASSG